MRKNKIKSRLVRFLVYEEVDSDIPREIFCFVDDDNFRDLKKLNDLKSQKAISLKEYTKQIIIIQEASMAAALKADMEVSYCFYNNIFSIGTIRIPVAPSFFNFSIISHDSSLSITE